MRTFKILMIPMALAALAVGCGDETKDDPATAGRDDLNPPSGLMTVTGSEEIELRFKTANVEEDFKGYNVFMYEGSLEAVQAKLNEKGYPKKGLTLSSTGIPRCKDNSAIFELFKFTASTKDCEGGSDNSGSEAALNGSRLTQDEDSDAATPLPKQVCKDKSNDNVSIPSTSSLGEVTCTVTGLTNGNTYTFFVAAVMGEKFSKMSWTSNFVEDTPATPLFDGEIKIQPGKQLFLAEAKITEKKAFEDNKVFVEGDCIDNVCNISAGGKNKAANAAGLYFGRLGAGDHPARVFISAPAGSGIQIQARGPQTQDPNKPGDVSDSIPGDQAINTDYVGDGTLFPLYGNQVFDIKVTIGTETHYGKIVIKKITLADAAKDSTEETIQLKIVLQTKASSFHYFR